MRTLVHPNIVQFLCYCVDVPVDKHGRVVPRSQDMLEGAVYRGAVPAVPLGVPLRTAHEASRWLLRGTRPRCTFATQFKRGIFAGERVRLDSVVLDNLPHTTTPLRLH